MPPLRLPLAQLSNIGLSLLIGIYPLAVYLGVQSAQAHYLPLLVLVIGAVHLCRALTGTRSAWLWVLICSLLASWSWLQQNSMAIKFYPVAVNLSLLLVFGWSLLNPPTVIERLARLKEPDLPDQALGYIRKVTLIWCGFFIVNGTISAVTVFAGDAVWALYNGLISYLLIGLLFGGEWLFRQHFRKRLHD